PGGPTSVPFRTCAPVAAAWEGSTPPSCRVRARCCASRGTCRSSPSSCCGRCWRARRAGTRSSPKAVAGAVWSRCAPCTDRHARPPSNGRTRRRVAPAAEPGRRKFRRRTVKQGTHPADRDQRGKDSWRHWHEGHAERVLMEGPGQRVLWERTEQESDPIALARRYLGGAD